MTYFDPYSVQNPLENNWSRHHFRIPPDEHGRGIAFNLALSRRTYGQNIIPLPFPFPYNFNIPINRPLTTKLLSF